jgi:hypothetical protein
MYPLIADVIALGIAYIVFFHILAKRAIAITCPHCNGYIETNTPWRCGNPNCQQNNERVDDFPFVYHCEHCGVEPKAYQCHHNQCGKIIFLSKDKLTTLCATLIRSGGKSAPPPRKNPAADKIVQENEAIRETEYKLRKAKLDLELKGIAEKLEPIKVKSKRERMRTGLLNRTEIDDEVKRMKADADKEFANDEPGRLQRYKDIEDLAREEL